MASDDKVEAERVACLIACGYAWNNGGGSQAAEVRGGGLGADFVDDFEDFGLSFAVFTDLCDFALRFMRELIVDGLPGMTGVADVGAALVLGTSILRGKLAWATAVTTVLSDTADVGGSSTTGETVACSVLLRVNIPRNPPFDSVLCILGCINGTRRWSGSGTWNSGGGRARRLKENLSWSA